MSHPSWDILNVKVAFRCRQQVFTSIRLMTIIMWCQNGTKNQYDCQPAQDFSRTITVIRMKRTILFMHNVNIISFSGDGVKHIEY